MNLIGRRLFLSAAMAGLILCYLAVATARAQTAAEPPATENTGENSAEELPELGDSSERVLSPAQAKKISQAILRALLRNKLLKPGGGHYANISDPELHAYLNRLGDAIARHAPLRQTEINVHLVNEPGINASAFVGGRLLFHAGLILSADDEDELASVLAHEIAHISQRHLPRTLAKAQASKLPALAGILASIAVGGETGLAGLKLTGAFLASNQLSHSREFEREADAVGIRLLAKSGFDPTAMARFFTKLERHGGLGEAPEFLRTHPLSYARIAEAESRAAAYPPVTRPNPRAFRFAQAKIRALYAMRPQDALEYFQSRMLTDRGDARDAAVYGLALTQAKLRQFDAARATLQPLLRARPNEAATLLAQAAIERAAGDAAAAAEIYARLRETHPALAYVAHYQADALLSAGFAAAAKRVLRRQLRRDQGFFELYPLLSKSNASLGLFAEAHQAAAEFHLALGEREAAIAALQQALDASEADGYLHRSISARLSELTPAAPAEEKAAAE